VKRWQRGLWLAGLLLGVVALDPITARHVRTASLLLRAGSSEAPTGLAALGLVPVVEEAGMLDAPTGPTRMKIYKPRGQVDAPALVLVPGVHRLGVDEPRLTRFARALSSAGLVVITPEVRELTDYRIDEASAGTIGAAAAEIGRRSGRQKVGVLGFSFAGGLSLLAAAHPEHGRHIGFVVSIGGHHDLGRVMRYLVTGEEPCADGTTLHLTPHDYGLVVLLYGYTWRFFSLADEPSAHEALRLWLADRRDDARQTARALSVAGQEKIEKVFSGHTASLAPELLAALDASAPTLARVSPRPPRRAPRHDLPAARLGGLGHPALRDPLDRLRADPHAAGRGARDAGHPARRDAWQALALRAGAGGAFHGSLARGGRARAPRASPFAMNTAAHDRECSMIATLAAAYGGASLLSVPVMFGLTRVSVGLGLPLAEALGMSPAMRLWQTGSTLTSTLLAGVLLAGGLGLRRRRPWSVRLIRGYAIGALVVAAVSAVVFATQLAPGLLARGLAATDPVQQGGLLGGAVGGVLGSLTSVTIPVALLILLRRPSVRGAFGGVAEAVGAGLTEPPR
jgi:hypothetical protein